MKFSFTTKQPIVPHDRPLKTPWTRWFAWRPVVGIKIKRISGNKVVTNWTMFFLETIERRTVSSMAITYQEYRQCSGQ